MKQEPTAWLNKERDVITFDNLFPEMTPLYEKREWVGLTDEEIDQGLIRTNYAMQTAGAWRDGVEWAVKQLKEKNT